MLFHSLVLPSAALSRARGTVISVGPNVPISYAGGCRAGARPPAASFRGLLTPAVAWARQNSVELGPDHPLDELPNPVAKPGLDRIEPVVEKIGAARRPPAAKFRFVVSLLMAWSPVRRFNAG